MKKAKPILFNAAMVKAIVEGKKTQTRRPLPAWQKPIENPDERHADMRWSSIAQNHPRYGFIVTGETEEKCMENYNNDYASCSPFGKEGDLLWVRENFQPVFKEGLEAYEVNYKTGKGYEASYPATDELLEIWDDDIGIHTRVKPSIHMPRWASRLTLEITGTRVERIQSITKEDAVSEGFKLPPVEGQDWAVGARTNFRHTWQQVYGDSWDNNDWVWVIDFKTHFCNIDSFLEANP